MYTNNEKSWEQIVNIWKETFDERQIEINSYENPTEKLKILLNKYKSFETNKCFELVMLNKLNIFVSVTAKFSIIFLYRLNLIHIKNIQMLVILITGTQLDQK